MALHEFDGNGNLLPSVHDASWGEVVRRFGSTEHRRKLLAGLKRALLALKAAGCKTAYIDGSFVAEKDLPSDFDACWDDTGVDVAKLDPVLTDFDNKRAAQKNKYFGEFFPANASADSAGRIYLDFFQRDRDGHAKGIVRIDVRRLR